MMTIESKRRRNEDNIEREELIIISSVDYEQDQEHTIDYTVKRKRQSQDG